ncbi:hypothetical protein C8R44DRAFT_746185 [Mycena epipterygia]|nr:hypothetical protein C8R44DRAFT_746185 [Mycena epipterygia]
MVIAPCVSLLSILPDGLSAIELVEPDLPIQDILGCRAILLQTSLAYSDDKQRLKSLVPIREHIHTSSPPSPLLFHPLSKYFHSVLDLHKKYRGAAQNNARVNQITSNLGNLHQLLQLELHPENPDLAHPCNHEIEVKYIIGLFTAVGLHPIPNPELLIQQGMAHFHYFNNPILESLQQLFWIKCHIGDYAAAQMHAHEAQEIGQLSGNLLMEAGALDNEIGGQMDTGVIAHLAEAHLVKSEYREARKIHLELFQKYSSWQSPYGLACALSNIATVDVMVGADALEVQQNLGNAKKKFSDLGMIGEVNRCEAVMADLCLQEGNAMVANESLQQCLKSALGKDSSAVSYCLERLADVNRWTSTTINLSCRWPVIYLAQAYKTQEKLAVHKALCFIGDVLLSQGDEDTAYNLFIVALEGFTYMDVHRSRADCMLCLGDIEKDRGQLVKAVDHWKMARPLFEQSSQAKDMAQIDIRLASVDQTVFNTHQKTLALLDKLEAPTTSLGQLFIHNMGLKSEELMAVEC